MTRLPAVVTRSVPLFTKRLMGITNGNRVKGPVMGLDYSPSRLGIAVTDAARTTTTPLSVVSRNPDHSIDHFNTQVSKSLSALTYGNNKNGEPPVFGFVIGWPLELSGEPGLSCRHTQRFAQSLAQSSHIDWRYCAGILLYDERFSTQRARRDSRYQNLIHDQGNDDSVAALHILNTAMDAMSIELGRHDDVTGPQLRRAYDKHNTGFERKRAYPRKSGSKAISRQARRRSK